VLNIIMTIPFGFLFPLIRNRTAKFSTTVFSCFLMSLGIELLQPLFTRSADVTDLINNVIGGMLGYGFYAIFKPVTFWILDHLKARN
ncbi:MAG: VanZ family protein, partial [Oscillospiraceae bacterium]|nr:VanZ family protein [Oscillospiraceae bacterium]